MGDLASDHDAAIQLIIGEYCRLSAHNPHHELLQYLTNVTDQGFEQVRPKYNEFLDRFETPTDKKLNHVKVTKVLASYFVALRNAADEIEGINRTSKQIVEITPIKTLDDLEDLPF